MDRQILFRGKRVDNGEWIEGFLFQYRGGQTGIAQIHVTTKMMAVENNDYFDVTSLYCPKVDPSTVGQYTGLTDKNGKKIFEGDIIEFVAYGVDYKGVASFKDGNFFVNCKRVDPFLDNVVFKYRATVIGNIHDRKDGEKEAGTDVYQQDD